MRVNEVKSAQPIPRRTVIREVGKLDGVRVTHNHFADVAAAVDQHSNLPFNFVG